MKKPTLHQEVAQYRKLLHAIQLHAAVTMNGNAVGKLIQNICNWSYAHRCGNGEFTGPQQQRIITEAFWKLLDVPPQDRLFGEVDQWKPVQNEPAWNVNAKEWCLVVMVDDSMVKARYADGDVWTDKIENFRRTSNEK